MEPYRVHRELFQLYESGLSAFKTSSPLYLTLNEKKELVAVQFGSRFFRDIGSKLGLCDSVEKYCASKSIEAYHSAMNQEDIFSKIFTEYPNIRENHIKNYIKSAGKYFNIAVDDTALRTHSFVQDFFFNLKIVFLPLNEKMHEAEKQGKINLQSFVDACNSTDYVSDDDSLIKEFKGLIRSQFRLNSRNVDLLINSFETLYEIANKKVEKIQDGSKVKVPRDEDAAIFFRKAVATYNYRKTVSQIKELGPNSPTTTGLETLAALYFDQKSLQQVNEDDKQNLISLLNIRSGDGVLSSMEKAKLFTIKEGKSLENLKTELQALEKKPGES